MTNKKHTVMTRLAMAQHCLNNYEVELDDLCRIGDVVVTYIGEENVYFTSVWFGSEHVCKVFDTNRFNWEQSLGLK